MTNCESSVAKTDPQNPSNSKTLFFLEEPCNDRIARSSGRSEGFQLARYLTCPAFSSLNTIDSKSESDEDEDEEEDEDDEDDIFIGRRTSLFLPNLSGESCRQLVNRSRIFSSPALMRASAERQVGEHLRRISDDFNSKIPTPPLNTIEPLNESSSSDLSLRRHRNPEMRPDSQRLPGREISGEQATSLPRHRSEDVVDSSSNRIWNFVTSYFRPTRRCRTQSESAAGEVAAEVGGHLRPCVGSSREPVVESREPFVSSHHLIKDSCRRTCSEN